MPPYAFVVMTVLLTMIGLSATMAESTQINYPAKQIYSSPQCAGTDNVSLITINSQQQLDMTLKGFQAYSFGQNQPRVNIDFMQQHVLLIHMGQQPTTGYSITLQNEMVQLDGQELIVKVNWQTPSAESILAQVMTSPCIFVQIPSLQLQSIRLLDQHGVSRLVQAISKQGSK